MPRLGCELSAIRFSLSAIDLITRKRYFGGVLIKSTMKSSNISRSISVVIPAFNEADSLPELIRNLDEVIADISENYEIIIVEDGSTDNSMHVLKQLAEDNSHLHVCQLRRNFGKATALDVGFNQAAGDILVTLDADLQDSPDEIPAMLQKLDEGYDLVLGWKVNRQDPLHKTLPSKLFNNVTAFFAGIKLHDFNTGLKVLRREVADNISIYGELHRYIPALAHWKGFKVTEIGVKHNPRKYGKSKFGSERYLRGFFDLLTVAFITKYAGRPMHFFGKIGLPLVASGLSICIYMTIEKLRGHFIAFRPLLTLGVLLLIVGILFFSTGFLGELILYLFRSREKTTPGHIVKRQLPHKSQNNCS